MQGCGEPATVAVWHGTPTPWPNVVRKLAALAHNGMTLLIQHARACVCVCVCGRWIALQCRVPPVVLFGAFVQDDSDDDGDFAVDEAEIQKQEAADAKDEVAHVEALGAEVAAKNKRAAAAAADATAETAKKAKTT